MPRKTTRTASRDAALNPPITVTVLADDEFTGSGVPRTCPWWYPSCPLCGDSNRLDQETGLAYCDCGWRETEAP